MNYAGKFDATFSHDGSAAPSLKSIHIDAPHAHAPADAIVVPDAHFLFNADFKRTGVDLILSGDDRELVLHDYFKGEKRAALASPDGAHLTGDVVTALTGHVEVSQAGTSPAAGQVIGHLTKLQGTATATRNGVSIILNNGDNVEKGDVVEAGSNSTVGITFIDGTVFGLSSNARMVLNEMVYDPNGSNNSTLFNLVAGTISFVAGQTAKHGDMKIDTPVATMGIRGTAVLVQIDFNIPGQAGAPNASFQVLVEPDGTTGSYVLFDKTTLQPIATVNQAGQQININNGVISQSNAPLSPDVQKLIQDVFTQKFTDNSNTKQSSPSNDTLTPGQQGLFIKLADGSSAIANYVIVKAGSDPGLQNTNGPSTTLQHIPGQPTVVIVDPGGNPTGAFAAGELIGRTGDVTDLDVVSGVVRFVDVNAGDKPTVKVDFSSFSYQSADHANVTANLSPLQLADIAATQVQIAVVPDPGNKNTGSATWTYSVADKAFDFLAAGEQLTLTYMVRVDNNYAPANETKFVPITITITGTNDAPAFTTSSPTIALSGGTSVSGGNLTSDDPTSGTLSFQDADLTDTHTVSTPVLTDALLNGSELPQNERDLFASALTASLQTDSTGTGNGLVDWKLADLPVYLADFIPRGETLVLTYTITVTDSQGAKAEQTVTVSITGTDDVAVVWIATTAPGSASGGFWDDAANWETHAVPTADDDVIIITDQLKGLTPSFPVKVDAPAEAKSITMNDFGESPPKLINSSTLDVGSGGLHLSADSVVLNSAKATINVAGATEILDHSKLINSGMLNLAGGGTFADESSIINCATGTIELSGGTLDVSVDIANSGQITVDPGAVLALNAGTIDGGALTITGAPVVENFRVSESESTTTTPADGVLSLTGSGVLQNGTLDNGGTIKISGSDNAFHNETVTANNALEILAGGSLLLDLGSSIANSNGAITVDSAALLTLNDASIGGGTVTVNGTLQLEGASFLANGTLDNSGEIDVSGSGNALDGETVINGSTGTIDVSSALTLDLGTSISGGTLNNLGTIYVETVAGATLDGVAVNNKGGTIQVDDEETPAPATLTLDGGATISDGTLSVGAYGTLDVSAGGATLSGVDVENSGIVLVEKSSTLTLDASTVTGGKLTNSGTVETATSSWATLDDVNVDNRHGTIDIGTGSLPAPPSTKLTLKNGTAIQGGLLTIAVAGILEISTDFGASLSGVEVDNSGAIQIDKDSLLALGQTTITGGTLSDLGKIHVTDDSAINKAAVTGGSLIVDSYKTLTLDGTSLTNTTVTNYGEIKVDAGKSLTLDGVTLTGGQVDNLGTVEIAGNSSIVEDSFGNTQLTVDAATTLTIEDTAITGGAVTVSGALDSTGTSDISSAEITIADGGVLEVTSGHLTIESAGANVGITNDGLLKVSAGELDIVSETVTNTDGTVSIAAGTTLDLVNSIISGGGVGVDGALNAIGHSAIDGATVDIADSGAVSVGLTSTLDLVDSIIKGGTINVAGTLDASGVSAIDGATICNTGVLEVTGGTLTIDAASHLDNKGLVEANGGNLIIDTGFSGKAEIAGTSTLELGADGKGAYTGLEIDFAAHSSATLKLDHAEYFTGEISNLDDDDSIDLADLAFKGATVSFSGDATGGTLTITSNGEVSYIKLDGDYLGSRWSLADDGSGGIKLTEVPGVLSGLDSHDNAVEGKAITVSITDGGATVTDPTYTFETSSNGKDWTPVQSGSSNSYKPTEADEGKQLKVVMSFTDHEGNHDISSISAGTVQEAPDAHPVILGETDPSMQTIILSESPIVLPQGSSANALGLPTEGFDSPPRDSNGFSHGNFFSSALDATFSASGSVGVVAGSSSTSAAPFIGPLPGHQDDTHYLSVGANGAETISFATEQNAFGLYWGSVDPGNKIDVLQRKYARCVLFGHGYQPAACERRPGLLCVERICRVQGPRAVQQGRAEQRHEFVRTRQCVLGLHLGFAYPSGRADHGDADRP